MWRYLFAFLVLFLGFGAAQLDPESNRGTDPELSNPSPDGSGVTLRCCGGGPKPLCPPNCGG